MSLHSHSMYSEESLHVLPRYVGKVPVVHRLLDARIDYSRAFWTPPLSPRQAYQLEQRQINKQFVLPGLVSLTDHDDLRAGRMLHVLPQFQSAPLSVEWTVPFGPTFFHIGIHNLPAASAAETMSKLREFSDAPEQRRLLPLLEELNTCEDVLLVLNHPLWDEKQIGSAQHRECLASLLRVLGKRLHALEVNGFRSFVENREVMELGAIAGYPVVSGGDRHGCEPNSILNLTRGSIFAEFVHEVRRDGRSHVVFMPQYRDSMRWRTMQTIVDILRTYPESFEGRRAWTERVYYRNMTGEAISMSAIWPRGNHPTAFSAVTQAVHLVQWSGVRATLRALLNVQFQGQVPI